MRYFLDILLLLLLIFEMCFLYMPRFLHELFGVALLLPGLIHLWQNRFYLKALCKGRWTLPRVLSALVNFLLLLNFLTVVISGCMISQFLFKDVVPLSLRRDLALFAMHSTAARCFFITAGLHFGLHLDAWWGKLQQAAGIARFSGAGRMLMGFVAATVGAAGIFAAVQDKLWQRLQGEHVFMTPALQYDTMGYILTQLGIFLLFAEIGWLLWRLALRAKAKKA